MSATVLQAQWREIATRWELKIDAPFYVTLSSGKMKVPVRLRGFGAPKGMLLAAEYQTIASHTDELIRLGFGYSCLSASAKPYDPEIDDKAVLEMLRDWGWTGPGEAPSWLERP
jgi:hypothetical protein